MRTLVKTTVYLTEDEYRRMKELAKAQKRPSAELVREAVAEFILRHAASSDLRVSGRVGADVETSVKEPRSLGWDRPLIDGGDRHHEALVDLFH